MTILFLDIVGSTTLSQKLDPEEIHAVIADSQRQVHGVFDVEAQPPIQVKGVSDPVAAFLVLRTRPRASSALLLEEARKPGCRVFLA